MTTLKKTALFSTIKCDNMIAVKMICLPHIIFIICLTESPKGKASMIYTIVGAFSVNRIGQRIDLSSYGVRGGKYE
jgi:hypothetical protein